MIQRRGAMGQERHQPEHQGDPAHVDAPEPTHSELHVRRTPSVRPEGGTPLPPDGRKHASRPPTPFGPPRTHLPQPTGTLSGWPPVKSPFVDMQIPPSGTPLPKLAMPLPPASVALPPSQALPEQPPSSIAKVEQIAPAPAAIAPANVVPPAVMPPKPVLPAPAETAATPSSPGFRGQVEDLLPLSDVTQSMPRIPLAAVFPALVAEPDPADNGRTLLQIGAFVLVLAASTVPVLRYTGWLRAPVPSSAAPVAAASPTPRLAEAPIATLAKPEPLADKEPAPAPVEADDPVTAAVERIEASLPAQTDQAVDRLVTEGERALAAGEERLAETLLAHALKRDENNPHAAYALAKVRLAQRNLEGAEGWVLSALRLRPRRAEYHALYADILARQGHAQHAKREKKRAQELRR